MKELILVKNRMNEVFVKESLVEVKVDHAKNFLINQEKRNLFVDKYQKPGKNVKSKKILH